LTDGLFVDKKGIDRVKEVTLNRNNRVVFVPVYKSYGDPLIMHYINYFFDLELGFTFGNYEDSPKIGFVDRLLKRTGTILIRRDPQTSLSRSTTNQLDSNVMNYVNQTLFNEVVGNNAITTLFQNDERLRTGKFTMPRLGEMSTKLLIKSHSKLEQ
jgi:glycerol-3-phosphate O-acyltransferase